MWEIEWLVTEDEGQRRVPAYVFLREQPMQVRQFLLSIVDAVRASGPDRWQDGNTHCAMHGQLSDLHEARDKQDQMLYRLFLLWQRDARRVIILDGRSKQNNTALSDAEYGEIRALADLVTPDSAPFAQADDFARTELADDA